MENTLIEIKQNDILVHDGKEYKFTCARGRLLSVHILDYDMVDYPVEIICTRCGVENKGVMLEVFVGSDDDPDQLCLDCFSFVIGQVNDIHKYALSYRKEE